MPRRHLHPTLEVLEDRSLLSTGMVLGAATPDDILVQFRTSTPQALPGTSLGTPLSLVPGLYDVRLTAGQTVAQALAAYRADPDVIAAQPDNVLNTASLPNDPKFSQQWSLRNTGQQGGTPGADIHATRAWDVTTGTNSVVVAVMDSGIDYTNQDLYQNIWINQAEIPKSRLKNLVDVDGDGYISFADLNNPINQGPGKITDLNHNGIIDAGDILVPMVLDSQGHDTGQGGWAYPGNTQDGDTAHPNDFIGWNFVTNTNNPYDDFGHGTPVAGVIAAQGNNNVGVAGVDWHASLMAVKFISAQGNGTVADFIAGLNYAVAHGAKISNNSWTGATNDPFLEQAIQNAQSHGDIFVAAAGNNGSNNDTNPDYPSSFPLDNIVSVAATDNYDRLAGFSNYGAHSVSLAAPGVNILSTMPENGYANLTGTSMSTPLVTGVLALVWEQHPSWTYQQVIQQVLSTVDPLPALAGKTISGGRLDAAKAVEAPPLRVLSGSSSGPAYNTLSDAVLTFNGGMDPSTLTPSTVTLSGPASNIPVASVTPLASPDTVFDAHFATQTAPGTYTLQVSSAAHDFAGDALQPYKGTFSIYPTFTFSSTSPVTIPAGTSGFAVARLVVNQDITVADVAVSFNLSYPVDGDLFIHLQAPDGTDVILAARRGNSGSNFNSTTFDDHAGTPIMSGQAPFAGSFQPEVHLAVLDAKDAKGTWKLWVENLGGSASGTLNSWSLTFAASRNPPNTPPPPPPPPPSPAPPPPLHIISAGGSGAAYDTFSDVVLTFNASMNPATLNSSTVTLTGPTGQPIAIASVTPLDNAKKVFDVHFATQTGPGVYTLKVSAAAHDTAGDALQPFQGTFPLSPTYTFASSSAITIPSGASAFAVGRLVVNQDIPIADVAVNLNLTYPADGDLFIHLQAPDGTDVILAGRRGGSGSNFYSTTFDDHAGTPIMNGKAPYSGSFRPEVALAVLNGKDAKGTWKLWVENLGGSASGTLNSWSLTFTQAPASQPQPATVDNVFSSPALMDQVKRTHSLS
jgi:subtilisin family serine protease/subtilisin-like proprotein convertase family protein